MADTYPLPNLIPPGLVNWQNNYFSPLYTSTSSPTSWRAWITTSAQKERIYGRYVYNNQLLNDISNNYLSGPGADKRYGNKVNNAVVLDSVTVFNPSTTLDIRASMNRWTQNYAPHVYNPSTGAAVARPAGVAGKPVRRAGAVPVYHCGQLPIHGRIVK